MSFILDAIKKSERERQRAQGPGIESVHGRYTEFRPAKPKWPYIVALLCAVNAALLLMYFKPWQIPGVVLPGADAPSIADNIPASAGDNTLQGERPAGDASEVSAQTEAPSPRQEQTETKQQEVVAEAPAVAGVPSKDKIKDLWQLPAEFQKNIPELHFSFHVYSDKPEDRTIIINNRRVVEGQTVGKELKLIEITTTGVILLFKETYFHIDVIEKW